jgi:hypothetical protein
MPRKNPDSDNPIELRNLPRFLDEIEDVMGVEKLITVAMAEGRPLIDVALLVLRAAALIRRDRAANAGDRDRLDKAAREFDEGLRQRERVRCCPLSSVLDRSLEVVVDEGSARTAADGTYFVARILLGLRDTAEDLRRRADNVRDRTRFEKAEREIVDALQRLRNSWDGRGSALEIIIDAFSVEAITNQTDFVPELLRELRDAARLKCEFADDYSRDRLAKTVRELQEALQRLDTQEGGEA